MRLECRTVMETIANARLAIMVQTVVTVSMDMQRV